MAVWPWSGTNALGFTHVSDGVPRFVAKQAARVLDKFTIDIDTIPDSRQIILVIRRKERHQRVMVVTPGASD
jgi:hypothetical protein